MHAKASSLKLDLVLLVPLVTWSTKDHAHLSTKSTPSLHCSGVGKGVLAHWTDQTHIRVVASLFYSNYDEKLLENGFFYFCFFSCVWVGPGGDTYTTMCMYKAGDNRSQFSPPTTWVRD